MHFSDFFEFKIINGVDRLDPTDHKYLKLERVKFNEKKRIQKL